MWMAVHVPVQSQRWSLLTAMFVQHVLHAFCCSAVYLSQQCLEAGATTSLWQELQGSERVDALKKGTQPVGDEDGTPQASLGS